MKVENLKQAFTVSAIVAIFWRFLNNFFGE
jgi:hypothetical protein